MSKKPAKSTKTKALPGIGFEKAIASIQTKMDPNATVTHDERICDCHGHMRQFDVVIRGKLGGHNVLGVIECKDLRRRVGTPEVDAFVTKSRDVNANIALLAAKRGFSKPAMEKAKHYGIGIVSLLPTDSHDCGFSVGAEWYAVVYAWKKVKLTVHFKSKKSPIKGFSSLDVTYRGHPVMQWFQKELATTYMKEEKTGWMSLRLDFEKTHRFRICGKPFMLNGITFHGLRVKEAKRKWIKLSGDALFDWGKSQLTIPPKGHVYTEGMRTDFSDWEEYSGEIPPSTGILDARITAHMIHFDPKVSVIDLSVL